MQTAIADGRFKTLVAALQAAELVTALEGAGPFTVFAPTDDAFAKLGQPALNDLLKPENKGKLAGILKYHVISGKKLTAADIKAMSLPAKVETLQGQSITVTQVGNDLKVNDAKVIVADVMATNGIIHAIDTVITPPATGAATSFSQSQSFAITLVCALLLASLRFF